MQVKYLFASEEIEFTVDVMNNSWIALGFGSDMTNTDMIAWHANGNESYSEDYWSTRKAEPKVDDSSNLDTSFKVSVDSSRVTFVTRRKLDTGDDSEDYLITLN